MTEELRWILLIMGLAILVYIVWDAMRDKKSSELNDDRENNDLIDQENVFSSQQTRAVEHDKSFMEHRVEPILSEPYETKDSEQSIYQLTDNEQITDEEIFNSEMTSASDETETLTINDDGINNSQKHKQADFDWPEDEIKQPVNLDFDDENREQIKTEHSNSDHSNSDKESITKSKSAQSSAKQVSERTEHDTAPIQDLVISINLMADIDESFQGQDLLQELLTLGFKFDDKGIFERYQSADGKGEHWFSLANAFNPGTFDLDNMSNFSTLGVTCFMILPGPSDPMFAFENMINACEKLRHTLGGQLQDASHSSLTKQRIQLYREQIQDQQRKIQAQNALTDQ